jgi:hypothetical protein
MSLVALAPSTGLVGITNGVLTADARAYAYDAMKVLSSLYLVSGLS